MSYHDPHYANKHAASHILLAESIRTAFGKWSDTLGEENAIHVLEDLVNAVVQNKVVEAQAEGACDFVDAIAAAFEYAPGKTVDMLQQVFHSI